MIMNKHGMDGYQLVKRISLGFSGLSENAFMEEFFPELVENYTIDKYRLFTNNCRHFSVKMIHVLRPSRPEMGLSVLSGLNTMSELLGKARDLIFVNLIRSLAANPMEKLQLLITVIENCQHGRLLSSTALSKDLVLVFNCILLGCFWMLRVRL